MRLQCTGAIVCLEGLFQHHACLFTQPRRSHCQAYNTNGQQWATMGKVGNINGQCGQQWATLMGSNTGSFCQQQVPLWAALVDSTDEQL